MNRLPSISYSFWSFASETGELACSTTLIHYFETRKNQLAVACRRWAPSIGSIVMGVVTASMQLSSRKDLKSPCENPHISFALWSAVGVALSFFSLMESCFCINRHRLRAGFSQDRYTFINYSNMFFALSGLVFHIYATILSFSSCSNLDK